ncbi:protein dispatched homolog 1-like [Ptychodera flava]|uniref:protein dispatched homolog 1-like n=1 Tax=Ptychodera flava TaxID=63121 RepID=UPI00396A963D
MAPTRAETGTNQEPMDRNDVPKQQKVINGSANAWVSTVDIVKYIRTMEDQEHCQTHEQEPVIVEEETGPSRTRKPLAWCKFIVKRPKTAFAITLCFSLSFLVVTLVLVALGEDVFPTVFADLPLQLRDDDQYLRYLAWHGRDQNFTKYTHRVDGLGSGGERTELSQPILIVYEKPGGNVFSRENLRAIKEVEDQLIGKPGYEDYCQMDDSGRCLKPTSIIRFFDGTYASIDPIFNDTDFENVASVLVAANTSPHLKEVLQYHLGKDAAINAGNYTAVSSITRSIIPLGLPLAGNYTEAEMQGILTSFISERYFSCLEELSSGYRGLDIIYYNEQLFRDAIDKTVMYDMICVVGSLAFIFFFMWFQTRSLWVTGFAVFGIITSFCGTNLIYRYALGFRFFGTLHVLTTFIILGIGADDVFVFVDNWKATGFKTYDGLEHRLSAAYRHASVSMLVTSLTTAVAFFVNAFSSLLGVKTFGIFAGILVLMNYVTVVTFLPTVVITHHHYLGNRCCPKRCVKISPELAGTEEFEKPVEEEKKSVVVRFLIGPYIRLLTHKVLRWIIVFAFIAMTTVFIYYATQLGSQEEPVQLFKDGNNFVRHSKKNADSFVPDTSSGSSVYRTADVYIVWGLKNQDDKKCHQTDYECTGDTVWDESFDLNPPPSQQALRDFCARLRNLTEEEGDRLYVFRNVVTGEVEVNCFIDSMYDFYEHVDLNSSNVRMPISENKIWNLMTADQSTFDSSSGPHDTFYRNFETGVGYWLTRGYTGRPNSDFAEYGELIGEEVDQKDTTPVANNTDVYGTRLRYVAIKVTTTLSYGTIGYEAGIPIIDAWEDFVSAEMEKMPPSVSGAFQCTCGYVNLWHWIKVQKTLADSAIKGVILGILLAFPLLTIATSNIILGAMATMSIGLTTGCVIGIIPIAGWKLGLLESLNLSLIVGLAVDYVVHLAEGYHLSPKEDRLGRLHDTLEHVGVSVVSGAATTLGASTFMLFAKILFFMQFGVFMFCTIGFSLLFSLGLFTTMLGIMGPQGRTGSLVVIYHWLIGRNKVDVDCDRCEGKGFHSPDKVQVSSIAVKPLDGNQLPDNQPEPASPFEGPCKQLVDEQPGPAFALRRRLFPDDLPGPLYPSYLPPTDYP